jgi:hypothetical protein
MGAEATRAEQRASMKIPYQALGRLADALGWFRAAIVFACIMTVVVVVGLTIYAATTKSDFTDKGGYICAAGLVPSPPPPPPPPPHPANVAGCQREPEGPRHNLSRVTCVRTPRPQVFFCLLIFVPIFYKGGIIRLLLAGAGCLIFSLCPPPSPPLHPHTTHHPPHPPHAHPGRFSGRRPRHRGSVLCDSSALGSALRAAYVSSISRISQLFSCHRNYAMNQTIPL